MCCLLFSCLEHYRGAQVSAVEAESVSGGGSGERQGRRSKQEPHHECLSEGVGLYAEGNQWGATKGF